MKQTRRKNAFTLIELLAVIVILAIIALIAVPVVMNIITKAQKSAFQDSAYGIIKAGELYYTNKLLEPTGMTSDKVFEFPNDIEGLEINGSIPIGGFMTVNMEGKVAVAIHNGKYCVTKGYEDSDVTVIEELEKCYLPYTEEILNGSDPVLKTGMIPVTIDADGTVKKADTTAEWYSYEEKVWANAVTVSSTNRQKYEDMDAGEEISESDILTYFVWIPRYKYKLWYTDTNATTSVGPHSIDIVFENKYTKKSDGTCDGDNKNPTNGCYLTHPAFTFGEEVNGIWVGKFETGYSGANSTEGAQKEEINSSKVIIKPSTTTSTIYSWRYNKVSNMYFTVQGMNKPDNVFGLTTDSDTHMMKNTEWGAVTYLSHSEYGTCKNGTCTEVYINNNNTYMTGCGGDSANEAKNEICKNKYGTKTNGIYNQSTTGNISGIFDMSGGALEYIMGYTTSSTKKYGQSGFDDTTFPVDPKYIDTYSATSDTQYSNRILGDATGEMGPFDNYIGSWYNDYACFVYSTCPWFVRGGYYDNTDDAGLASFRRPTGVRDERSSFRVIII